MNCNRFDLPNTRREFLQTAGCGFGAVALAALMGDQAQAAPVRLPQRAAKAKSVIFLFMEGGPSHLDTFDYKPLLNKLAGQSLPASFKPPITAMGEIEIAAARMQTHLEAARPGRTVDLRLVQQRRAACRRSRCDSFLRLQRHQSRRRCVLDEHRLRLRRSAIARRVGAVWTRHREP
jgi:hypothetical protein